MIFCLARKKDGICGLISISDTSCPGILAPPELVKRWYKNAYDEGEYKLLGKFYFVKCNAVSNIHLVVQFRDAVIVLGDRRTKQYITDSETTGCLLSLSYARYS